MMYSLRITLFLLLYQAFFQLGETSNIFLKAVDDDDDDSRHDVEKPFYDVVNPPLPPPTENPSEKPSVNSNPSTSPSKSPSIMKSNFPSTNPVETPSYIPSQTPSNIPSSNPTITAKPSRMPSKSPSSSHAPSKYVCKTDGDGSFGNTSSQMTEEKVSYKYEVDVNMTQVNSNSGGNNSSITTDEAVSSSIAPNIKTKLSDSLFPAMFDQCQSGPTDPANPPIGFQDLKGMSTKPDDALNSNGCGTGNATDDSCAMIDGGYTLYFAESSTRRRLNRKESLDNFLLRIKTTLESNDMLSAHPAIIKIRFIETITKIPVVVPRNPTTVTTATESASSTSWWIYVVAAGAGGLLITAVVIGYRKIKNKNEDNSVSEGSGDSESSSDNEVTWNHAIQTEMKRSSNSISNSYTATGSY